MILSADKFGLLPLDNVDSSLLRSFISSKQEFTDFLLNDAQVYQNSRIANTTCVFHEDSGKIVAYYTLSNSSIKVTTSEFDDLGINASTMPPAVIPAVLIGKFAINSDYEGCGNGRNILNLLIGSVIDEHKISATRLIVVDSANDAAGFYQRCGFVRSLDAERKARNHGSNTVKMYKDILNV